MNMDTARLRELSDDELKREVKKLKNQGTIDAVIVGFLIGVVIYSVVKGTFGWLMLIPICFVYKLIKKPQFKKKEVEAIMKERGLS